MSESSEKGKSLENYIAKTLQKKLGARVKRDGKSGAGTHQKMDISDFYDDTTLAIEAKNQSAIKLGEWWKQTVNGASIGKVPTLVVQLKEETLAVVRFEDLVNFLVEIKEGNDTIADLRRPINTLQVPDPIMIKINDAAAKKVKESGASTCRNGHLLAIGMTVCFAKGCPYSAGYKAKKVKK